jgi:hypothetical protein
MELVELHRRSSTLMGLSVTIRSEQQDTNFEYIL